MTRTLPPHYRRREHAVRQQAGSQTRGDQPGGGTAFFHADGFTMALQDGWTNETVYRLEGPVADDLQHTIQISVDPSTGDRSVLDYADMQIEGQTASLPDGRLLTKRWMELDSGRRAYRALLVWSPTDDRQVYRDQLYAVHNETGYRLSASFTRRTIETIGPMVDRAFHRFEPHAPLRMRRAAT